LSGQAGPENQEVGKEKTGKEKDLQKNKFSDLILVFRGAVGALNPCF
jgi:hypothetical protein